MTRIFSFAVFALGAAVVLWMGASFIHSNALALLVTVLIAAAYTAGFVELLRYQRASELLDDALQAARQPVVDLNEWLKQLHPSLRFAVRQRIYGEATGLPAPLFTPYLVGLLVMLGLLGTFIGMVETLQGAVAALEGSTELEAVRAGLAAPIQGLGMAFATSVAGITASAMLGLISTVSRKQRLQASRQLDAEMAGAFKQHSLSYQRRHTYEVLQAQSAALPAVAEQLGTLAQQLDERMQTLVDNLSISQQTLQQSLAGQYQQLSESVQLALSEGFRDTGRLAAESAQPVLKTFADTLASETDNTRQHLVAVAEQQLAAITDQLGRSGETLQQNWQAAQHSQEAANERLMTAMAEQMVAAQQREAHWQGAAAQRLDELIGAASTQLRALRNDEQERGNAAVARLAELQETSAKQLAELGAALEQPMSRLIETASDAPRAAAEVIEQLRGEISKNIERDNVLLEERQHTLSKLEALSASLEENARLQREAVQAMLEGSAAQLSTVGHEFGEKVNVESSSLSEQMAHFSASAAELSAVGEVFNTAVQQFGEANGQLMSRLEQIESVLVNAGQRSDEQMAYYLSQAREIIDHNLISQQELLSHVREINGRELNGRELNGRELNGRELNGRGEGKRA